MSRGDILFVGAGGHARACIDVVEQGEEFQVSALLGLPSEVGADVLGYPVVGTDADLSVLAERCSHALVTVGQIETATVRVRLFDLLVSHGYSLPAIVSPLAYVSRHASVGAGSIVMHGAIVNAGAVIGRNCIINSRALIEHDTVIADHCHVSTGALINSGVSIGRGVFIGSGSSVRQGITIADDCLIGMGTRVIRDCETGARILSPKAGP